ncbi:hypothetical protein [Paenibacillus xerothermodurans]|uniref:Uncharacterized protein n=1 Tax=Paenibacillus xerothermodurans TaxID=1977292 RepID=A0A2W1NHI8_PAEXE|nr:hypothetical protein [Paenibacillus xerothermodurans]PZE22601.1 hypothetical protein CBW46_002165 [Paenibacillus xerothermodurans]
MFNHKQKQLILDVLMRERRRLFSKHRGQLLDQTIADLQQMLRNEGINAPRTRDNSIDWSSRKEK